MTRRATVLALDAGTRAGVWVIRSLGRKGIRVIAGDHDPTSIGFRSRFAQAVLHYPHPTQKPAEFIGAILDAIARYDVGIIFPSSDMTLAALAAAEELLRPRCILPIPDREHVEKVLNKWATIETARALGIPCPVTLYPSSKDEALAKAVSIGFPLVLKPVTKATTDLDHGLTFKYAIVTDPLMLKRIIQDIPDDRTLPLIQAYEDGFGVGVEVLMGHGEALAVFQHRRLREKPPAGGVSVLCVSEPVHPVLAERALRLLRALRWEGPAMVEFRQNERGPERATLMEINGRFWGSLALPIACGVDFPYLAYQLFVENRKCDPPPYRAGVRNQWILGDLAALLMMFRRAKGGWRKPHISSVGRTFLSFVWHCSPFFHHDVLWWRDPMPALQQAYNLLTDTVALCLGRLRGGGVPFLVEKKKPYPSADLRKVAEKVTDGGIRHEES
jgi:predicted ATP-grasp superfamily ATP-dependent carboligase